MDLDYNYYMDRALCLARLAMEDNEVPVGCVIVYEGKIIGEGFNMRNTRKNALYHAELTAIDQACEYLGDWRLTGCTIFITLEPCPMCAGAIVQARITEAVIGAKNPKAGCCGSILNILDHPGFNHQVKSVDGVREDECAGVMKEFFKRFRRAAPDCPTTQPTFS